MAGGANSEQRAGSVDAEEVARFAALADDWWDPQGRLKPLHALNPTRLGFIRDRAAAHFGRDPLAPEPLKGLKILDIGCGGGLVAEPLARLGGEVLGIDAGEAAIQAAVTHAAENGVAMRYRATTAEALREEGAQFDLVVTLEVVEHVADLEGFLQAAVGLVAPGGALVAATLNRTLKAFATAIVGAEYLLRWLPRGSHDWRRFVKPSELVGVLRREGLEVTDLAGLVYNPLTDSWRLDPQDLQVNYMLFARRPD